MAGDKPGTDCSICIHPDREQIDRAILAGEPKRAVAAQWAGFTASSVQRHKTHLDQSLFELSSSPVPTGEDLLDETRYLHGKALEILDEAMRVGALKIALDAIKTAQGNVELQAKLRGLLQEQAITNNLLLGGSWTDIKASIHAALEEFPEARQKVARALLKSSPNG